MSYQLNQQATKFSEMFGVTLHPYVLDNWKANSCYLNTIVDRFHAAFEKEKSDGTRMFAKLTYELVCNIIGVSCMNQDIGITIRESVKFFENFRLGLDVLNEFGEMLFSWRPEKQHIFIRKFFEF